MSAFEIESIIRMQEQQLQSSHPYVDDFYYQNFLKKSIGTFLHSFFPFPPSSPLPLLPFPLHPLFYSLFPPI